MEGAYLDAGTDFVGLKPATAADPMEPLRVTLRFFCWGCFEEEMLKVEDDLSASSKLSS